MAGLFVIAVLLLTGAALMKFMFLEDRGTWRTAAPSAIPAPSTRSTVLPRAAFLAPVVLVLGLAIALGWWLTRNSRGIPSALIDKTIPTFSLPPVQGRTLGLSTTDLRGEISLVNVFASWCATCREEHPIFLRLKNEAVVPVHGLNYKDRPADAARWLDTLGDPYTRTGADINGHVAIDWEVDGVPATLVISKNGRIVYKHAGAVTPEVWQTKLRPIIESLRRRDSNHVGSTGGEPATVDVENAR